MNEPTNVAESCFDDEDTFGDAFKPSEFYFRRDLRNASTRQRAVEVGLVVVAEYERLRAWIREQGMVGPKWVVSPDEAKEKGWATEEEPPPLMVL